MKLDLRNRCARPLCHKLIRANKMAQGNWKRYKPYCSFHCQETHNMDKNLAYTASRRTDLEGGRDG